MLYLVRHGEAKTEGADSQRTLTESGAAAAERVAAWAARAGVKVDEIRHSGKRRAEQTAEIFANHLRPPNGIRAISAIAPNDDAAGFADALRTTSEEVMIVSHLPFLARLTGALVANDPNRLLVKFHSATMVGLEREGTEFVIDLVVHPEIA